MACPVCGGLLLRGIRDWHLECSKCSYEGSTLEPHIVGHSPDEVDESLREEGLLALRRANFRKLALQLRTLVRADGSARPKLLDVGSAHGWFLDEMSPHFSVDGIEPDEVIADASIARGLPVRKGFFPDALHVDERFDVISFNDVLEHIPDINGALASCVDHLSTQGIVMVNAPSRRGVIYRTSRVLARMGFGGSFERMWQKDFPSPHVHYLDTSSVEVLADRHRFDVIQRTSLPAISTRGLYARVRLGKNVSVVKAMGLTLAIGIAAPFLRLLPADIEVWYLRRRPG